MEKKSKVFLGARTAFLSLLYFFLLVVVVAQVQPEAQAQGRGSQSSQYMEENNQIRRERFDLVLPANHAGGAVSTCGSMS